MSEIKQKNTGASSRPLPTFGLRLGLMMAFMLIGLVPLLKVYVAFRLNSHTDEVVMELPFDLWSQALGIVSILTLVGTVLAWRGSPSAIWWVYQAIILLTLTLICAEALVRYYSDCDACIIQINQDFMNRIFRLIIPLQLAAGAYVLWYINRPPAKRFYQR